MKKRFISLLLTVLMILSLFSGLSIHAYAATTAYGANTIEYTMGQGDYVLRICQKLGLNYYTCKDAIMILNNIYDGQWNKLAVGRVLTLPASDYDAVLITNGARTTTYNSGAAATTANTGVAITGTATTGTVSTANTASFVQAQASADTLAYYLVPYTMSYGETVSGVCNNLGVNFSIFSPFIKQVNNIASWNRVKAGDTLIIPTPVCPSVGTSCFGVMKHVVSSKDTAYGIVSSKGVSYAANELLLKALNQTDNLAAIKAGSNFFYPVPMTVSVPGTGNPGATSTTTTVTTTTDGNGTTTTSTTSTSKLYTLTSGMSASDGIMLFYVNNQAVTAAPAGAKVSVLTDTNSGKAIQSLTVKHADGTADLYLSGDSFIMPSCNVRVDANIKSGHDINITSNYSGKAAASVGGVSVQSAVKGATVVIKSTDPNYEIYSVSATYKKLISSSTKTALSVSSSNAFIMPDADVDVEITLRPVSTFAFYVNDPANGSFYLQVNGSPVTRAAKGAAVTVVAKADAGYEPLTLSVKNHNTGASLNVFSNTFTMPAFDVDVEVTFTGKGNNIMIMPSQVGSVFAFAATPAATLNVNDIITESDTGKTVYLGLYDEDTNNQITSGYTVDYDVIRNSDGLKVPVSKSGTVGTFTMPKGGVTVTPVITSATAFDIKSAIYLDGTMVPAGTYRDCSFSVTWNGKTSEFTMSGQQLSNLKQIKGLIPDGEYIDLRYACGDGVGFLRFSITDGTNILEEETNEANLYGYFKMPNKSITVNAYFEAGSIPIGHAAVTGVGSVGYQVNGASGTPVSSATCLAGDTVTMYPVPGNGYKFDDGQYITKLVVTRKDNGAVMPLTQVSSAVPGVPFAYQFTMPAEGVNVQATFDAKPFVITMKCFDEVGNPITGQGIWQIAINWVIGAVDLDPAGTKVEVAYEDYVTVAMTEAGWSEYDMVSFRIDGHEYVADVLNYFYNFQMIDERAKDLEIIAVLRPRVPSSPSVHALSAMYDTTKGGVEFILLDKDPVTGAESATKYASNINGTNYYATVSSGVISNAKFTKNAFAGDYVAIIANSVDSKYNVDTDNITIVPYFSDADRIVPTKLTGWTINGDNNNGTGYTLYVFKMPDSDVGITVNFAGTKQSIVISVVDENGNPVNGMVRLFANNIYRDVAANNTFDDVAYGTQVQVLRSELALAEGKIIKATDIQTTAGKPITYADMSSAGEGVWFTMPDESVTIYVKIGDLNYNVPTIVLSSQVKNGTLSFSKNASGTPESALSDFNVGDTVYVVAQPDAGYKDLDVGELKVLVNGSNNAVNLISAGSPSIWQFKLPAGTVIFQAEFQPNTIPLSFFMTPAYDITAYVDGSPVVVSHGGTINVPVGATIGIEPATADFDTAKITASGSGKFYSDDVYIVPDSVTSDSLNIVLTNAACPVLLNPTNGSLMIINNANGAIVPSNSVNVGDNITVFAVPNPGYQDAAQADVKVIDSDYNDLIANGSAVFAPASGGNPAGVTIASVPAGGIAISATFAPKTYTMTLSFPTGSGDVSVSVDGGTAKPVNSTLATKLDVTFGQKITITPINGSQWNPTTTTKYAGFDVTGGTKIGKVEGINTTTGARVWTINEDIDATTLVFDLAP